MNRAQGEPGAQQHPTIERSFVQSTVRSSLYVYMIGNGPEMPEMVEGKPGNRRL